MSNKTTTFISNFKQATEMQAKALVLLWIMIMLSLKTLAFSKDLPNIIYIYTDDLGYGDVSCLNPNSKIQTPNIDKLAQQGMNFTDAHSSASLCTPSRYSVLTGRYPWRSRLKRGVLHGNSLPLIEDKRMTVASFLKKEDYNTACIGKWHLGMVWETKDGESLKKGLKNADFNKDIITSPNDYGFDYFFGISASLGMAPHVFIENRRVTQIPDYFFIRKNDRETNQRLKNGRDGWMVKSWDIKKVLPTFTKKAVYYINEQANKENPFFLYFSLSSPHKPIAPNDTFIGMSQAGEYGDFVVETDWVVGQIMKAVKENQIEENTLIYFTSDNGPERIMYNIQKEFNHDGAYHFRGCKRDNWEGGHRVPFIVSWKNKIKAGSISEETISQVDLLATTVAMFNKTLPDNVGEDSYNLLPIFLNQKHKSPLREATMQQSSKGDLAIRQGDWVLLIHEGSGGNPYELDDESPLQLYNLKKDISQKDNVYKEYPKITNKLQNLAAKYIQEGRSTKGKPQKNDVGTGEWYQIKWLTNEN